MMKQSLSVDPPSGAPASSSWEADAWRSVGAGWRQLFGSFRDLGLSFEWHDFESTRPVDWARSFHPRSTEICLNLAGHGLVRWKSQRASFGPMSTGFYCQGPEPLEARRIPRQRHQFITVELSRDFLVKHLRGEEARLHPLIRAVVRDERDVAGVAPSIPLTPAQQSLVTSLRTPPVFAAAQSLWYQSKAVELMAQLFFQPAGEEMFCTRQNRLARERVEKVVDLLKSHLAEPPSLEAIGRQVGCSPFYLSRTFSSEMGTTIPQYLRRLRMERAAELLQAGKHNVTEAALEVGYSSLSHFSLAFHQTFGCCPGLYPLATPVQQRTRQRNPR
jgi:AraC-like DNA-binding protein